MYNVLISQFDAAKLRKLRPSFKVNGGTVTAGNASSIRSFSRTHGSLLVLQLLFFLSRFLSPFDSDGAAALVLVSGEKALKLGLQVIAKVKGYGDAAQVHYS